jgi:cyclic pyranopterin phosphate synthase
VDVRFIEEMPFNGEGNHYPLVWTYKKIIDYIKEHYPGTFTRVPDPQFSTSYNYHDSWI